MTLPLIPLFMALIGVATRSHTNRQLRTLQVLSGHFLDVVSGLPTLKVFGRSRAQVQTIREVTDSYRRTTMTTLRLAFLSSLVLEFLASIAVALVAVSIGLRLLHGHVDLRTALFVLVLAPEAYLPLRLVGTQLPRQRRGPRAQPNRSSPSSISPLPPGVRASTYPTRPGPRGRGRPPRRPTRAVTGPPSTGSR